MTTETTPKPEAEKIVELGAEIANVVVDDGGNEGIDSPPQDQQQQRREPAEKEAPKAPGYIGDGGRAAIAERFKKTRQDKEPGIPSDFDYSKPENTYGQVAKPEAEPEPPPAPAPAAPPANLKLKVRGEDREVTRDEAMRLARISTGEDDLTGLTDAQITRHAQMAAASGEYLSDARKVFETARETAPRVEVSRRHPDGNPPATEPTDADDPDGQQHPADPIEELVDKIQFGDKTEAAKAIRTTLTDVATEAVKKATTTKQVQDDIAADIRAHDEFVKNNPEIDKDKNAHAVVRSNFLEGYREDLRRIGVPEDKIPKDADTLANHHRQYKLQGQPVRSVAKLLDAAKEGYVNWRGGTTPKVQDPPPQTERRVSVSVDRDTRRQAIPHQPSRANVPQNPQPAGASTQSVEGRRAAVQRAQRARGQPVT